MDGARSTAFCAAEINPWFDTTCCNKISLTYKATSLILFPNKIKFYPLIINLNQLGEIEGRYERWPELLIRPK